MKAILRVKIKGRGAPTKKLAQFHINNLMIHLKTLEKHVESYLKWNRSKGRNRLMVQIK